jgi:ribosomal protein L32
MIQGWGRILRPFTDPTTGAVKTKALIFDHTGTSQRLGYLEDYEEWSLEDGVSKNNKQTKPRKVKPQVEIVCEECATIFMGTRVCPNCGLLIPISSKTEDLFEAEGELVIHTYNGKKAKKSEWTVEEKRDFYGGLLYYARSTGKKDGWAYHKYFEKFGVNVASSRSIKPVLPNPMVLAFLEKDDRRKRVEKQNWLASDAGKAWLEKKKAEEVASMVVDDSIRSFVLQAVHS